MIVYYNLKVDSKSNPHKSSFQSGLYNTYEKLDISFNPLSNKNDGYKGLRF